MSTQEKKIQKKGGGNSARVSREEGREREKKGGGMKI